MRTGLASPRVSEPHTARHSQTFKAALSFLVTTQRVRSECVFLVVSAPHHVLPGASREWLGLVVRLLARASLDTSPRAGSSPRPVRGSAGDVAGHSRFYGVVSGDHCNLGDHSNFHHPAPLGGFGVGTSIDCLMDRVLRDQTPPFKRFSQSTLRSCSDFIGAPRVECSNESADIHHRHSSDHPRVARVSSGVFACTSVDAEARSTGIACRDRS